MQVVYENGFDVFAAWKLGDVDVLDIADHVRADEHVFAILKHLVGLELVLVDVFARAGARDVVELGSTVIGHGVVCAGGSGGGTDCQSGLGRTVVPEDIVVGAVVEEVC